jgi:hypothetical protein
LDAGRSRRVLKHGNVVGLDVRVGDRAFLRQGIVKAHGARQVERRHYFS